MLHKNHCQFQSGQGISAPVMKEDRYITYIPCPLHHEQIPLVLHHAALHTSMLQNLVTLVGCGLAGGARAALRLMVALQVGLADGYNFSMSEYVLGQNMISNRHCASWWLCGWALLVSYGTFKTSKWFHTSRWELYGGRSGGHGHLD